VNHHLPAGTAIRKALVKDVPAMARLINGFAAQEIMLPRSHYQFYQHIRDFSVAEREGEIIACGALQVIWEDQAEVRSLAVAQEWQGKGIGRALVATLLDEAHALGLPSVFALTYRDGFFSRLGFGVVPHQSLPHKIWGDCLNCPKFPNCDEIAMRIELDKERPA
jgi:amino-acid N-acetyltransferase